MSKGVDIGLDDILGSDDKAVAAEVADAVADAAELVEAEPPRDPAWHKFEADLRVGLRLVKRQVMTTIRDGKPPKKVTVTWVLREAGRGRSQFYAAHAGFEARVDLIQRAVERLVTIRTGQGRRLPAKGQLADENRQLKTHIKTIEAREISKLAAIAFEKAFPRDIALISGENSRLRADVARLEGEIQSLRSYIRSLGAYQDISAMKTGNVRPFRQE
jgi:hypothetical protein